MLIHVAFLIAAFFALWGGKRYRQLVQKNTLQSMHLRLIVERLWAKGKLVQPGESVFTVCRRLALLVHQVAWFTGRNGAPVSPDNAGDAPDDASTGPRAFRRATGPSHARARDPPLHASCGPEGPRSLWSVPTAFASALRRRGRARQA